MSSGGSRHGSECEHGGLRQKCRVCELEAEVDELKRLRIADNKNYGLELRDPYGTIWQEAKRLQDELAARERELAELRESHAAFVAKVRELVRHVRCGHVRTADKVAVELQSLLPYSEGK